MNTLRNKVSLIGHLGQTPEYKEFENNGKLTKFSIATNEYYTDKKGEKHSTTTWHNVLCWGKTAELANNLLDKGQEVALEGKLVTSSYEKNGETRYKTEIEMKEFILLGKKESSKA